MKRNERVILCLIACILFFVGMCLDMAMTDSSLLHANDIATATISLVDYIEESEEVCTVGMLRKETGSIRSITDSSFRWQSKAVLLLLVVGMFLQALLGRLIRARSYQRAECKEDGQLLLCRYVSISYIHQQDGEK